MNLFTIEDLGRDKYLYSLVGNKVMVKGIVEHLVSEETELEEQVVPCPNLAQPRP